MSYRSTYPRPLTPPPTGQFCACWSNWGSPLASGTCFSSLTGGAQVRIVTAHGLTDVVTLHRGVRQGVIQSPILFNLLLEPLPRALPGCIRLDPETMLLGYRDDLLLIVRNWEDLHAAINYLSDYLAALGMAFNPKKCRFMTTCPVAGIYACLSGKWVYLTADLHIVYLGVRLDPKGIASLPPKHFARVEALAAWACGSLSPSAVAVEAMRATIGGVVRFSAAFCSSTSPQVKALVRILRITGESVGKLAFDFSNFAIFSAHGMAMPDIGHLCRCGVISVTARLARHRCKTVREEVAKLLKSASDEWGICTEVFFPCAALSTVQGPRWEDRLVQALATLGVGLLASSVAPCPKAWRPQVQQAGDTWVHGRGVFNGNAVCIHSGPARDQDIGHLAEVSSSLPLDLASAAGPCFGPCVHTDSLKVGIASNTDWVAGMTRASGYVVATSSAMRLIHPIRKKLHADKATKFSRDGQKLVVGGYRMQAWDGQVPAAYPSFLAPASLAFILEDIYWDHTETTTSAAYGLTKHHEIIAQAGWSLPFPCGHAGASDSIQANSPPPQARILGGPASGGRDLARGSLRG